MRRFTVVIALFIILLIAIFSGFSLALIASDGKILGIAKHGYLIIHVASGSLFILVALAEIIIRRKQILKMIKDFRSHS